MSWKPILKAKPYKLINNDCTEAMKLLPDNSIDAIITDGPYGIGFMGKEFDTFKSNKHYMKFSYRWAKQAFRVLKPGGYLLSFSGTRTYHWMAVGIEEAGFVCRDMISWLYGSGMPKSHNIYKSVSKIKNISKEKIEIQKGKGTNLKPCQEPIAVFQKPISEKTIAANCLKWGTGAINIDAGKIKADENLGRHNKIGKTTTLFGINRENHSTDKSVFIDNSNGGRWPGNVILDGSKEVLNCFPYTKSGKLLPHHHLKASKNNSMSGNNYERNPSKKFGDDSGSAGRFFYCAKVSTKEREAGLHNIMKTQSSFWQTGNGASGKPSSIEKNRKARAPRANNHPTVKPVDLMRYLISIYCPHRGIVLDPFLGSGTTGIAAIKENKQFIGIERDKGYFRIATRRVGHHYLYR